MGRWRYIAILVATALCFPLAADPIPPTFRDAVPEAGVEWSGAPVSMSLRDADLVETLRTFARLGEFNLLIQPGVRGRVTVELKEVPWDQAMSMILRMHGLGMDITQGTIRIGTQAELLRMAKEEARVGAGTPSLGAAARPRLKLKGELEFLDAKRVVRLLEHGYLSERGRAEAKGKSLTIIDEKSRLKRLGRLVARLDIQAARGDDLSALRRRATQIWPDTTKER